MNSKTKTNMQPIISLSILEYNNLKYFWIGDLWINLYYSNINMINNIHVHKGVDDDDDYDDNIDDDVEIHDDDNNNKDVGDWK